jgi:hypothetical protein
MKILAVCSIGLWIFCCPLFARDVDLFGYFESQWMGAQIHKETIQLQSNKLRLDLKGDWDRVQFGGNINWITYHGKTRWQITDYLPAKVVEQIPEILRPFYVFPFDDNSKLDNAYVKISFNKWDLTMGKQQISLGSGYAWNPTDLFNTKDLFDPTYEQPGHNAVRADIALAGRWNLTALIAPEENWDQSAKLVTTKIGLGRFDIAVTAIEKMWLFHDYSVLSESGFAGEAEKRDMVGGSIVGELLGLGVWIEGGYNDMRKSTDFTELVAGLNYTFASQTFIMFEYFYNSACPTKENDYTLNDWMRYLSAEQKTLTRHQIYMLIQHPISDLTQLGLSIIAAGDGSVALLPSLTATPFENVEVTAYANFYFGSETAAFNKNLGNGGLIRLRVYF